MFVSVACAGYYSVSPAQLHVFAIFEHSMISILSDSFNAFEVHF